MEQTTMPIEQLPAIAGLDYKFLDALLDKSVKATTAKSQSSVIPTSSTFPDAAVQGELLYRLDLGKLYFYTGSAWLEMALLDSNGNLIVPGRILKS